MGISKLKDISQATATTLSSNPIGTYPYMVPEMFGPGRRGPAVDIYSFGCLLIELFGQQRVWGTTTGMQIMQKVCGSFKSQPQPPAIDHLPMHVQHICKACCQLDSRSSKDVKLRRNVITLTSVCIHFFIRHFCSIQV